MTWTIAVVAREVWDTRDLTGPILDDTGQIRPGALQTRFDPEDLNALEAALRIKDAHGARVVAVGFSTSRQVEVLRECLYRGADAAIQSAGDPMSLSTESQARVLAEAIRSLGTVDLVLVGTAVPDDDNGLLARALAAELDWPAVSWVDAIEGVTDGRVTAKRAVEMGYEYVEAPRPAVLAIGVALLEDDPRAPRPAKAMLKLKMKKAEIPAALPVEPGPGLTQRRRREPVPPRVIETTTVDPENEDALRAMLDAVRKGV